jgi:hypothetical protein
MSQQWEFLEDSEGVWRWRATSTDGTSNVSCRSFRSGVDCVVHAIRHGYLAGTPMAEALRHRDRDTGAAARLS